MLGVILLPSGRLVSDGKRVDGLAHKSYRLAAGREAPAGIVAAAVDKETLIYRHRRTAIGIKAVFSAFAGFQSASVQRSHKAGYCKLIEIQFFVFHRIVLVKG
jgi:hypothetical protein